jgi:hypothetical protein
MGKSPTKNKILKWAKHKKCLLKISTHYFTRNQNGEKNQIILWTKNLTTFFVCNLSMKNPTKILYLMICPPENIKNGKLVSATYTWHKLGE